MPRRNCDHDPFRFGHIRLGISHTQNHASGWPHAHKQHQKEIVDPFRDRADAWLNLPAGPPLNSGVAFDVKSLTFLMRKAPKVMMAILMEASRYRLACYSATISSHVSLYVDRPHMPHIYAG
jgi:hypothetical protein